MYCILVKAEESNQKQKMRLVWIEHTTFRFHAEVFFLVWVSYLLVIELSGTLQYSQSDALPTELNPLKSSAQKY